jgi:hypothetical protein
MIFLKEFLNYILLEHVSLFNLFPKTFKLFRFPIFCQWTYLMEVRDRPFNLKWGLCFPSEPDLFHAKPKSDYFVALDVKNLSFYFNFHQHLLLKTTGSAYIFFACCRSIHFFHKIWEHCFFQNNRSLFQLSVSMDYSLIETFIRFLNHIPWWQLFSRACVAQSLVFCVVFYHLVFSSIRHCVVPHFSN